MFILLGTDLPPNRRPVVTETLIILMMAAYLAVLMIGLRNPDAAKSMVDGMMLSSTDFHWWQLITYQFAHDNPLLSGDSHPLVRLLHLGLNLMYLWVFGGAIEGRMGRLSFALFAVIGGMIAGGAHMMASPAPVLGASGMVGALAGAFLVLSPRCRVRVLVVFILIRVWMIPALWIIAFFVIMDIAGWAGLRGDQVSYAAHLGGYAWGIGIALLLMATSIISRTDADFFSLFKQWRRRQEFRRVANTTPDQRVQVARTTKPSPPFLAEVRLHMQSNDLDTAATIWMQSASKHPEATLAATPQLTLANHLQASGERAAAAEAYERYLARHGHSPKANEVRLLLALLLVRSLENPTTAIPLLNHVLAGTMDQRRRTLAESLLQEATA
jgi:membrane associated rhomboid family serine protease